MSTDIVIDSVTKEFRIHDQQAKSIKERFISMGKSSYTDFLALDDVSFEVPQGSTVGLLGHNGSGKSTLLKCVAGTLRPNKGSITYEGRLAALLELGAGFHPDLTGRENIYLNGSIMGMSSRQVDRIFDDVVAFAELSAFIDQQVKYYSSGMYARLGFAMAVNVDPEILLIDEVLAVGDEAFARKCLDRIDQFQKAGTTILFVSHSVELARELCDQIAVLDAGRLVTFGDPNDAVRAYRASLHERGMSAADEAGDLTATGEVKLLRAWVELPNPERAWARPDEQLRIHVIYEAAVEIDDIVFAIALHDQRGTLIHASNSMVMGTEVSEINGKVHVTYLLTHIPLLFGTYDVSLGAHTSNGGYLYSQEDAALRFDVGESTEADGIVEMPFSVTVESAATEAVSDRR